MKKSGSRINVPDLSATLNVTKTVPAPQRGERHREAVFADGEMEVEHNPEIANEADLKY
jgi:hypothetical protein